MTFNRTLLNYLQQSIRTQPGRNTIGGFHEDFLRALQRSLAASQRPINVAYAASRRFAKLFESLSESRYINVVTNVDRFRTQILELKINIESESHYNLDNINQKNVTRLVLALFKVYESILEGNNFGPGKPYKFQISFENSSSEMYFIENAMDLRRAILNIIVKYDEQINVFVDEEYVSHVDGEVDLELNRLNNELKQLDENIEEHDDGTIPTYAVIDNMLIGRRRREIEEQIAELSTVRENYQIFAYLLQYNGNRGNSIPKYLRLPPEIVRSVIDPANKDKYCFFHCLNLHKSYTTGPKRTHFSHYADPDKVEAIPELTKPILKTFPFADQFYNEDFDFKYSPQNIQAIEKQTNVNINIYNLTFKEDDVTPIITCDYRSNFLQTDNDSICRLLYVPYALMSIAKDVKSNKNRLKLINEYGLQREEIKPAEKPYYGYSKKDDGHFVYIPESSKLLFNPKSSDNTKKYLCPYCDLAFWCTSEDGNRGEETNIFKNHKEQCKTFMSTKSNAERMCKFVDNEPDSFKEFTNYHQLTKQSWICYADTETITKQNGEYAGHQVIAYMLYLKCNYDDSLSKTIVKYASTDEQLDCMQYNFARDILNLRCYVYEHNGRRHYTLKEQQKIQYLEENFPESCGFCKKEFEVEEDGYVEQYFEDEINFNRINFLEKEINYQKEMTKETKKAHKSEITELKKIIRNEYVIHHCHNTGEIVDYLCPDCNKREATSQKSFSVVFHNLPYDLLTLLYSFAEDTFDGIEYQGKTYNDVAIKNKLEVIAQSSMKYSTITIGRECINLGRKQVYIPAVKFIDSFRFISKSLSSIIETMGKDGAKAKVADSITFKNTYDYIMKKYKSEELFSYATQKGLIAYDAINIENLKHKGNLPKHLYKSGLSMVYGTSKTQTKQQRELIAEIAEKKQLDKDYERTQKVYNILENITGKSTMTYRKYFLFYLELDIMLMADYFESLRKQLIETHKIDPAYHQGLASYSQNCFLYSTKTKLHLIEPVEVSKTIIDNCRGGYSGVMKRISENFQQDPKKLIKYWDVNNLYGYAMIQKLANKFLGEISIEQFQEEVKQWTRDGDFAYFLLCDYTIPVELHDRFAKFAPLITKKTVVGEEVSLQNKTLKEVKQTSSSTKLCSTLENGENFLMDYENYLFYTRMGYKITIKSVQKYEQEYILKQYIDMNSALRQQSTNEINKQLYKDLNNICYGKSLQNPMKYSNIELLTSEQVIKSRIHNPLLKRCEILVDDKLVLTDLYHDTMKFNTCIQYGFHILEKSKLLMYTSLYEKIVPFCEAHNVDWALLMHDTDSFCFEFLLHNSSFANEKEFILKLHEEQNQLFDLHVYEDSDIKDSSRKKVVGYFLDEYSDSFEVVGFVGLAAKSYCYVLKDIRKIVDCKPNPDYGTLTTTIKGKGMRNSYLDAMFTYEDFKEISINGKIDGNNITFRNIMKKNFANIIVDVTKVALSSYDDKWFIYKDEKTGIVDYLPYGHYKIAEIEKYFVTSVLTN